MTLLDHSVLDNLDHLLVLFIHTLRCVDKRHTCINIVHVFESIAINLIIQAAVCEPLDTYLQYVGRECAISSSELWAVHVTELVHSFEKQAGKKCMPVDDDEV